ncbi:MAG TPA: thioredoxin domain-containing protein [Natronosporangium sp.]|nr:thioredoxin domain-containing protein [Natronosporangium sp.]
MAALLVVGILGIGVWLATRPDPDAAIPPSATSDEHGLAVGTGPVPVEIYLDFMCPACQQFDAASRPILEEYLAEGTVTVIYRPIAILNRYSTTRYSTRAAAAAGCAADAGQLDPYVAALFTNQPQQGGAGLSDDQLVELGNSVGLGEEFAQCVRDGTYHDWAKLNTDAAADRGVQATPTVFVDGQRLDPLSLDALAAAIDRAAAGS